MEPNDSELSSSDLYILALISASLKMGLLLLFKKRIQLICE